MSVLQTVKQGLRGLRDALTVRRRIRGSGHVIRCEGASLREVEFDVDGVGHHIMVAPGASLRGVRIFLRGRGHRLIVEAGVRFHRGGDLWMEDDEGLLRIGADTTVEQAHLAVTEHGSSLVIGRDCQLAYGIDIRTGDSHAIVSADTGARLNPAAPVSLGDHTWVGAHVSILRGACIGPNCVVGTRSVVTRGEYPPHAVLAGAPARVIQQGVDWRRDR